MTIAETRAAKRAARDRYAEARAEAVRAVQTTYQTSFDARNARDLAAVRPFVRCLSGWTSYTFDHADVCTLARTIGWHGYLRARGIDLARTLEHWHEDRTGRLTISVAPKART